MPEENEVSLIVKGYHSSPSKLRLLREKRGQHSTNSNTHFRIKII